MAEQVKTGLMQATEIARQSDLRLSTNGVRYTAFGETDLENADLARIVQAVPATIASSLGRKAYYFVPLTLVDRPSDTDDVTSSVSGKPEENEDPMIATTYTAEWSDRAICHRDVKLSGPSGTGQEARIDGVFISTRLLGDRFALAFEFFINVSHAFVDIAGIPQAFSDLVWAQAVADVRGETSRDAWESRALSMAKDVKANSKARVDEKAKTEYLEAAFSDAIAIYQLSLAIDFEYAELRERDYPLLAPKALADRLRMVAKLFPPNSGYEFAIRYKRRG